MKGGQKEVRVLRLSRTFTKIGSITDGRDRDEEAAKRVKAASGNCSGDFESCRLGDTGGSPREARVRGPGRHVAVA